MATEARKAIENGIWLCAVHARLIDSDESRFTVEMLRHWKVLAEHRARVRQELGLQGIDLSPKFFEGVGLAHASVELTELGTENRMIGDALADSCMPAVWGYPLAHAVRDFAIEYTRNAFQHGGATQVELDVNVRLVTLRDNGRAFDAATLLRQQPISGGAAAFRALLADFEQAVVLSSIPASGGNSASISLVRTPDDVVSATPCSITLTRDHVFGAKLVIETIKHCGLIYVVFPKYFSISDVFMSLPVLGELQRTGRQLVFVLDSASQLVQDELRKAAPAAQLLFL